MLVERETVDLAEHPRPVDVDVCSVVVRLALLHIIHEAGWDACQHTGTCRCLSVRDRCTPQEPTDVLVVRDEPAACQDAIDAVVRGDARSIVMWNEPDALAAVFEAIRHRSILIPHRTVELAAHAPRLSARQRATLRLIAVGRSNHGIAASLHQSVSTAKRDIAELLELFDVPNRAALMSAAGALGFLGHAPSARAGAGM